MDAITKAQKVRCPNGPLNLLGGGSWHWPAVGVLDGKTLSKIRHSEIGGVAPEQGGAP
jgi:hypothetical protein